ncbi:hypothetical protein SAMD00019534_085490 [Acytostelium subglobosum LB1]|uniref:hypothetical protein n=1 Tax=Acytostelium subglobosum LB1 TaxID=1410327 RepID=UPI000644B77B|nr:hypothetical protein SAMD00019534_085490 [Acytostelium subglobosum LB1]GAM25374.1 hypothetical protein SAMD00019534_085490 [Acytostelium subglobosum LB1]|eukprot:XP_012751894.1 hypothetical protein SAMD00019534_085490 [Acytostelium subglobosum LB1]
MFDFAIIPITMIMMGCCANVVSLEAIIKADATQSQMVTFSQFVFVAFMAFLTNIQWSRVKPLPLYVPTGFLKRKIPLRIYGLMVSIFFVLCILNNWALSFNISLPFHMIFRSSSLLATVVISAIFYKRKFTFKQIVSLIMVTVGITMATFGSTPDHKKAINIGEDSASIVSFIIGITMLTVAMFLSSILGLIQETSYANYGKDCHRETIFYSHFLALPFFALFTKDLTKNILANNNSPAIGGDIPFIQDIPSLWFYLLVNVVTQYICIQGVFILTGKTSTLTCTLVISLRKFISIIISVLYFQNPFTPMLWVATVLVLVGTFIYSDPFKAKDKAPPSPPPPQAIKEKEKEKIKKQQ